jgi:hypothetical protein
MCFLIVATKPQSTFNEKIILGNLIESICQKSQSHFPLELLVYFFTNKLLNVQLSINQLLNYSIPVPVETYQIIKQIVSERFTSNVFSNALHLLQLNLNSETLNLMIPLTLQLLESKQHHESVCFSETMWLIMTKCMNPHDLLPKLIDTFCLRFLILILVYSKILGSALLKKRGF